MSRVQLALNVSNVDEAVGFYTKLFGVEPAKRRPGYANFAISEPPLKLVLIENADGAGTLNHLGVEVESTAVVAEEKERIQQSGLKIKDEDNVECCYALQNKFWTQGVDNLPWETYTVLGDSSVAVANDLEFPPPTGHRCYAAVADCT